VLLLLQMMTPHACLLLPLALSHQRYQPANHLLPLLLLLLLQFDHPRYLPHPLLLLLPHLLLCQGPAAAAVPQVTAADAAPLLLPLRYVPYASVN
jgi:hypothetical protein